MSELSAIRNVPAGTSVERDEEVIARVLAGDMTAYRVLVDRYQRAVYSCAWQLLGSDSEAEEAAQETFVQAFEKLERLRDRARFFSWIWRICSTVSLKRRGRERRMTRGVELDEFCAREEMAPREVEERSLLVARALGSLPDEQREVLTLRFWEGLDYDRIAELVGVSHEALYQRASRGIRALKSILGDDFEDQ